MKKAFFLLLTAMTVFLFSANAQAPQQQEKTASATLTESQWAWILEVIRKSKMDGDQRDEMDMIIKKQIVPQLYPQPAAKDTTKPKTQPVPTAPKDSTKPKTKQ